MSEDNSTDKSKYIYSDKENKNDKENIKNKTSNEIIQMSNNKIEITELLFDGV
jgi:hypothetical protein